MDDQSSFATLVDKPIWAGLKSEARNGAIVRVAISPLTGQPAVTDDRNAWRPLEIVRTWVTMHDAAGVAVRLGEVGDTIVLGADLHACRDPETGEVAPWAREVTSRLKTRTEVSPGGAGLHPLFCLSLPNLAALQALFNGQTELIFRLNGGDAAIKLFGVGAYLAVTEEIWGDREDLRTIDPADLEWLCYDFGPMFAGQDDNAEPAGSPDVDDEGKGDPRLVNARRFGADLKFAGVAYDECRTALLDAEDDGATAGVAEWARIEGMANNERELRRLYNRSRGPMEVIDTRASLDVARLFQRGLVTPVLHHRRDFFEWNGSSWPDADEDMLIHRVYEFLDGHQYLTAKGAILPVKPDPRMVGNVLNALRGTGQIDKSIDPPLWLDDWASFSAPFDGRVSGPPPNELVACANGLLHLPTKRLLPHTPAYFNRNGLDFAYDPKAPPPKLWLSFLDQVFPGDPQSIATLQEIFGLCLTPDTSYQKMFWIIGPRRCGKGTIGRVLVALIGKHNCGSPTLADLAEPFELEPLIGKLVALITDANLSGKDNQAAIVEVLKAITGEDARNVRRKYKGAWFLKLNIRFVILANDPPKLSDPSGAFAARVVLLQLTQSFENREDLKLTDKLLTELPSILNWAIAGWDRLKKRGHFQQPASAAEAREEFQDLSSSIGAFVRERCDVGPRYSVDRDVAFHAWELWFEDTRRKYPGDKTSFGRLLRSVIPGLTSLRPRVDGEKRIRIYQGIRIKPGRQPGPREPDPGRPGPGEGLS
jgi:P4 family phage/plasmid primase-like protien